MSDKPIVIITGASGNIGSALSKKLRGKYRVVGMDRPNTKSDVDIDLTSDESVELAFREFRQKYVDRIAAVIHLAAYFDFTGEKSPLYDQVNVNGSRRLLEALTDFEVGRLIYSGTMLVHRPARKDELVNENSPVEPKWAYPESKAETEAVIRGYSDRIPCTFLHLAGLYDESGGVPTLTHQIARIYEWDFKSQLYAGDLDVGQAFIHLDDMLEAFALAVEKRNELPAETVILAGEDRVMSYRELQNALGELIHGEYEWRTYVLPEPLAKAGAWIQENSEPVVPDAIDKGEKPFIRPFLIDLASDHYALDISRARDLLGWEPRHFIGEELSAIVKNLKADPLGWYRRNGIRPPDWMEEAAEEKHEQPEALRKRHERGYREEHNRNLWGHLLNTGLGAWLLVGWLSLGYESAFLVASDIASGLAILVLGLLSLSWRLPLARWLTAAVGCWLLAAPLFFWAPTAAAYLNDTLVGTLVIGFSVLTRPAPGVSPVAAVTGPTIPPGWDYSPSSWFQRLLIIILAFVGFYISHYLASYQLGHIDGVWEPFFSGARPDAKNGTEEIITSPVSEAWPVPDAGVGALTYLLEILTGIIGSTRRWRTMPWLVLLFGIMIVPLGAVSITFIIIQPILLDTWCTLCLIAAAAMVIQIPYSLDELIVTCQFLDRRRRAGRPLLSVLLFGDTDDGPWRISEDDNFAQSPPRIVKEMLTGGISFSRGLVGCVALGVWLMFTPITLGATGAMADANHLIGSILIVISVTALAEVARPLRYFNMFLGLALLITPFIFSSDWLTIAATVVTAIAVMALSIPLGPVKCRYGTWDRYIF